MIIINKKCNKLGLKSLFLQYEIEKTEHKQFPLF